MPEGICAQLFGYTIRSLRWADISEILIVDDYNQDRMKREVRCRLQAGSHAIGFKDFIQGYADLLTIVEGKAGEFRILVSQKDVI